MGNITCLQSLVDFGYKFSHKNDEKKCQELFKQGKVLKFIPHFYLKGVAHLYLEEDGSSTFICSVANFV